MLNEEQISSIVANINGFKEKVDNYNKLNLNIIQLQKELYEKENSISEIAEEEKILENVMSVLYTQQKNGFRIDKLQIEINNLKIQIKTMSAKINEMKSELILLLRDLPIPVNINDSKIEGDHITFKYYENVNFGSLEIKIIRQLLNKPELRFNEVILYENSCVVLNENVIRQGILKLVEGIKNYRLYVNNILKSYEQIDEMLDRMKQSVIYTNIILLLYDKKELKVEEIANRLGSETRKAYDACYNLTRKNWSPNPINYNKSNGKWELTISGEIIAERYIEKFGKTLKTNE